MKSPLLKFALSVLVFSLILFFLPGCKPNDSVTVKSEPTAAQDTTSIPDTIIQFLITSALLDFQQHHPPTPVDFRDLKIGYLPSPNPKKTYILCGEFLSAENNEWIPFATIKTSPYEQYIGKTQYCSDAVFVATAQDLTAAIKSKH